MWPSNTARYCTSDHKRDQVGKLITKRLNRHIAATTATRTPARVLNCMGAYVPMNRPRAQRKQSLSVTSAQRMVSAWLITGYRFMNGRKRKFGR